MNEYPNHECKKCVEQLRAEVVELKAQIANSAKGWAVFGEHQKQKSPMFYSRAEAENWVKYHPGGLSFFDVKQVALIIL
jgi:hypothetical protein